MSEPSSVYARIHISEAALAAYKASALDLPNQYTDWRPWLEGKEFYGELPESEINELDHGKHASVNDALNYWLDYPELDLGQSTYDAETKRWTICFMECSENYADFILVLSFLRGIAHFKDQPGEDYILITPYIWGGTPEAYVVVTQGSSSLSEEIPESVLAEANAGLKQIWDAMINEFADLKG